MIKPQGFMQPVYITRPKLPSLEVLQLKLEEIWASGWITNMGPQHKAFEQRLKEYLQVENVCLFCNGTLALQLACQVLRLSGEVITTPFTFPATTHVLYWNRIRPVFCDIDSETLNMDPNKIEALITPDTTAILPVHVFGYPCEIENIQEIADRHGLKVIYDAAHAFGVTINGQPICEFGDISMLSFHATKLFHSVEGGALVFQDSRLRKRLDYAKNFGFKDEETIVVPGINAKMNEIQAAIGLLMLDEIEVERSRRKELTAIYRKNLSAIPGLTFRYDMQHVTHNYYNMVILVNNKEYGINRNQLHEELKQYNIITRKYFYPLCSQFQCYRRHSSATSANLAVAEKISEEVLSLPLYGALVPEEINQICNILDYIGKKSRKRIINLRNEGKVEQGNAPLRISAS